MGTIIGNSTDTFLISEMLEYGKESGALNDAQREMIGIYTDAGDLISLVKEILLDSQSDKGNTVTENEFRELFSGEVNEQWEKLDKWFIRGIEEGYIISAFLCGKDKVNFCMNVFNLIEKSVNEQRSAATFRSNKKAVGILLKKRKKQYEKLFENLELVNNKLEKSEAINGIELWEKVEIAIYEMFIEREAIFLRSLSAGYRKILGLFK